MAKKKETKNDKDKATKKVEKKINTLQAVTFFKLNFYDCKVVKLKYKGREMTIKQWVEVLREDNINFVF